jgi:erythromycin esterase-like protein
MPSVATVPALVRAATEFAVTDLSLVTEPAAAMAVQRSLADAGLLLLGEVHGVREHPLLIRALMQEFAITALALEWDNDLASVVDSFISTGTLTDHPLLWSGDGRITVGQLAVLAERAAAGRLRVVLFDGPMGLGWSWSQRDEAMADRILAGTTANTRMLVAAGNAHTPTSTTPLGVPLGAHLARRRPGVRELRISYGSGSYYNSGPRQFPSFSPRPGQIRLREQHAALVLDLPVASEAIVPHRLQRGRLPSGSSH